MCCPQARGARLARDVLHDRDGALAHERDGHRVGAHGLARDAASGVAGVQEGRGGPQMIRKLNPRKMRRLRWTGLLLIVLALFGCARGDWINETLTLVDVTGTWEGAFQFQGMTRGLERNTRWVLQQKGGKVRGEAS